MTFIKYEDECGLCIYNIVKWGLSKTETMVTGGIAMSENNINPKIENEINNKLDGEMRKNALDFVAYMKANGMTNHATYSNAFEYDGKWVCIMIIDNDGWTIYDNPLTKHYDDFPIDESMKEFAWAHVHICATGHCESSPGVSKKIFGKSFENVCTSEVAFRNPSAETLQNVMQMIDIWKQTIDEGNNNV